ncbi:hypothetical protein [Ekhidna sp.]|uniref:hypothetical protein n=1 Tax=Ekhidna sp. TaxID=2608089 RepID=UPI00351205DF
MNVLLLAANRQSFSNVEAIGLNLKQELPDLNLYFLNTQELYKQYYALDHQITPLQISLKKKTTSSFYLSGWLGKIRMVLATRSAIKKTPNIFDVVIAGDLGVLEYLAISSIQRDSQVYFIQDAILLWKEKRDLKKKIRHVLYGFKSRFSKCDLLFCSGEVTRKNLISSGAEPTRTFAVGIPRFDEVKYSSKKPKGSYTLLVIGEAYSWHGLSELEEKQNAFFEFIDEWGRNNDVNILVRKHPRDFNEYDYKSIQFIDGTKESLQESIAKCNVTLSYALPSTVMFEIVKDRIPVLYIKDKDVDYRKMECNEIFFDLFYWIDDYNSLNFSHIQKALEFRYKEKNIEQFISVQDSSHNIINKIINDIASRNE